MNINPEGALLSIAGANNNIKTMAMMAMTDGWKIRRKCMLDDFMAMPTRKNADAVNDMMPNRLMPQNARPHMISMSMFFIQWILLNIKTVIRHITRVCRNQ